MSKSPTLRLSLFREIAAFGAAIARIGGRRTWTALFFLILGSLTEGISILLLIPLLHLVGRADQDFAVRLPNNDFVRWLVPDGTLQLTTVLCMLVGLVAAQAAFNRFKSVYMAKLLFDFVNRVR
ncbi:MAG: ABC transporter ATP-binding protein, partial [Mesorhizobium sp.]